MASEFEAIFARLRRILRNHAESFTVQDDTPQRYCLAASAGPAAVAAWGGKIKRPEIPIAWVEIGKAYVSYHLMGIYGNTKLLEGMSKKLKARMQGKTCFNFKTCDEELFGELERLSARSIAGFRRAGYIA